LQQAGERGVLDCDIPPPSNGGEEIGGGVAEAGFERAGPPEMVPQSTQDLQRVFADPPHALHKAVDRERQQECHSGQSFYRRERRRSVARSLPATWQASRILKRWKKSALQCRRHPRKAPGVERSGTPPVFLQGRHPGRGGRDPVRSEHRVESFGCRGAEPILCHPSAGWGVLGTSFRWCHCASAPSIFSVPFGSSALTPCPCCLLSCLWGCLALRALGVCAPLSALEQPLNEATPRKSLTGPPFFRCVSPRGTPCSPSCVSLRCAALRGVA
jgi:hypothetical protein